MYYNSSVFEINNTTIEDTNSYFDYFDKRFPKWISIVILFIGVLGNILTIAIFGQKKMRKNSTFTYLGFLASLDLLVLLFGLGDIILITYFEFAVRNYSILICRIHTFFTYASTHLSSFTLASVSIDRAIATNFLTYSKKHCTPRSAYKIIAINVIISTIINSHNLIFMGSYANKNSIQNEKTFICATEPDTLYDHFMNYYKLIDLFSYAIVPFITMAICTFFIIRALLSSNKRLQTRIPKQTRLKMNPVNENLIKEKSNNSRAENVKSKKQAKTRHLTYTLITLNCLFILFVGPLVICLIFFDHTDNKILLNIVYLLAYANHSFNFIFYGFSSPPYRECLFKLLRIHT
jgi:hypothetical protein